MVRLMRVNQLNIYFRYFCMDYGSNSHTVKYENIFIIQKRKIVYDIAMG